jgi:hypothetical protein
MVAPSETSKGYAMSSCKHSFVSRIFSRFWLFVCRLFQFFRSGQENDIKLRCRCIKEILKELSLTSSPAHEIINECHALNEEALRQVQKWPIFHFREAWAALQEVRHRFCRLLPRDELIRVVVDISNDLPFIANGAERRRHTATINEWVEALSSFTSETRSPGSMRHRTAVDEPVEPRLPHSSGSGSAGQVRNCREEIRAWVAEQPPVETRVFEETLHGYREELLALSLYAAQARDMHWRRANLLRWRLRVTGACMFTLETLLIIVIFWRPEIIGLDDRTAFMVPAVAAFGSLGGLLSSLHKREPLAGDLTDFYIGRALFLLLPIFGAIAGLIVYFLVISGFVNIPLDPDKPTGYLVLAFSAGFSERFFLRQLGNVAGREGNVD